MHIYTYCVCHIYSYIYIYCLRHCLYIHVYIYLYIYICTSRDTRMSASLSCPLPAAAFFFPQKKFPDGPKICVREFRRNYLPPPLLPPKCHRPWFRWAVWHAMYIYTYIYRYIYTYTYTSAFIFTYRYMYIYLHTCVIASIGACCTGSTAGNLYEYTYIYTQTYIYIYIYIYLNIYMYIHIHMYIRIYIAHLCHVYICTPVPFSSPLNAVQCNNICIYTYMVKNI